jgi:hypothetical protein
MSTIATGVSWWGKVPRDGTAWRGAEAQCEKSTFPEGFMVIKSVFFWARMEPSVDQEPPGKAAGAVESIYEKAFTDLGAAR